MTIQQTVPVVRTIQSPIPVVQGFRGILVIYCSDERYRERALDYIENELDLFSYDQVVLPGGPGVLVESSETSIQDRARVKLLLVEHKIDWVVLISHTDCAYYKHKYPDFSAEALRAQQEQDLLECVHIVRELAPRNVRVSLFFDAEVPEPEALALVP